MKKDRCMHVDKIDFVLPWVDGNDHEWRKQKQKYYDAERGSASGGAANADCRYKDLGLLRYWFRAIENFTPWVNRIFFITCGQKPDWLNEANPKLRLINHKDYIPAEYLPTFQSNTIELNVFRIPDLSEHFVLFNDDVFVLKSLSPDFFFKKGYPVLSCNLGMPYWIGYTNGCRVIINNNGLIAHNFNVWNSIWTHWTKFFSIPSLGLRRALKNLIAFTVNRCIILGDFGHFANPHLKSTFLEIWHRYPEILDNTSRHKFRADDSVNQWLACAWNMLSGRFSPTVEKRLGQCLAPDSQNVSSLCNIIEQQSLPQICLFDPDEDDNSNECYLKLNKAFNTILPHKSSFEK